MEELAECPICHGEALIMRNGDHSKNAVKCGNCHLQTDYYKSLKSAVKVWNK